MLIIWILGALLLLGAYWIWRYTKCVRVQKKYEPLMPPISRLTWKSDSTLIVGRPIHFAKAIGTTSSVPARSEFTVEVGPTAEPIEFFTAPSTLASAADGAIAGGLLAHTALNIDPDVLHAIEFSTAQHLHGLPGINEYVHDHFFSAPMQSADGWFERLTGYVAEQKAASALEQLGHHIEFAPVANQPVWDLLVDGHPVQIKESLAGVKDFVAQHPGIDVYTDPHIAVTVKDNAVHGLAILDKDSIHVGTQHALGNVDGALSPDLHLPFITMAFSSWREAKLLWNEKTSFERAVAYVGLDVAGVGGGAWTGAKCGALAGGFIGGPVGAAIGGFFGAILGGISGKILATGIRYTPFNSAREEYNHTVANAQSSVTTEITTSQQRVVELQGEYQQLFLLERNAIEEAANEKIAILKEEFDRDLYSLCERFPRFLDDLKKQLDTECEEILSKSPSSGFLAFLFPGEADLYRRIVVQWFRRAEGFIRTEQKHFAELTPRNAQTLYSEIQRFLGEYTFELQSMGDELGRLEDQQNRARQNAESILDRARQDVEVTRGSLIRDFGKQVEGIHERILSEVGCWNSIIESKRLVLRKEAAAVGLDF